VAATGTGPSNHRPDYLLRGLYCQLDLGNLIQAREWLDGAARELHQKPCPNCQLNFLKGEASLALAEGASISKLRAIRRKIEEQMVRLEKLPHTDFVLIRLSLIDPLNGDPLDPSHPAYHALSSRLPGDGSDLADKYSRALLTLDLRLGALRYALGKEPAEDLYYIKGQRGATIANGLAAGREGPLGPAPGKFRLSRNEISRRASKTRSACWSTMAIAKRFDELLRCSWRQRVIQGRLSRLDSLIDLA
jgi:hypothetical protein